MKSYGSDDEHPSETPISVRCFLTVLVLRDTFTSISTLGFSFIT